MAYHLWQRRRRSSTRVALSLKIWSTAARSVVTSASAGLGTAYSRCASPIARDVSAFLAPAFGGRERESMSNRTVKYTAGEIGRVRVIKDFLPAPDDLVPREDNVKVTLSLSRRSLDFFKREAKKRRVPYQRMIRALVDTYAERQAGERR